MTSIITTATGSKYLLDDSGEHKTLARLPGATEAHPSMDGHEVQAMRRDGEAIPVLEILRLEVGKPALYTLDLRGDGVITLRTTSEVVSIESA